MTSALAPSPMDLAAAAELLDGSTDYRVLRRFVPRTRYNDEPWNLGDKSRAKVGLFVDVETTGLDTAYDEIVEFAAVPFTYDATTGVVYEVLTPYSGFQEPKVPMKPDAQAVHGITEDMLKGQRLDDAAVKELVGRAAIVLAHHAAFDRPLIERRFESFREMPFGCSYTEVPWESFGCVGKKLEHVLYGARREFYDAHRALDDVLVGVHCLGAVDPEGRTALSYLLEAARTPTTRVWARRAPFDMKDDLKARGYRWHAEGRTWYFDARGDQRGPAAQAEIAWLDNEGVTPEFTTLTARDRYSVRADR